GRAQPRGRRPGGRWRWGGGRASAADGADGRADIAGGGGGRVGVCRWWRWPRRRLPVGRQPGGRYRWGRRADGRYQWDAGPVSAAEVGAAAGQARCRWDGGQAGAVAGPVVGGGCQWAVLGWRVCDH
ncbi:hypothetical protein STRIP9103_04039, partial [Streptomyces ipomoeae 91-03]